MRLLCATALVVAVLLLWDNYTLTRVQLLIEEELMFQRFKDAEPEDCDMQGIVVGVWHRAECGGKAA